MEGSIEDESMRDRDRLRLSRALFPDLAVRLDAALERNRGAAGRTEDSDFDARLDAEATERFASAGLADLAGSEGGSRLERAFAVAGTAVREFLPVAGLALPEPEAFEAAGVDLQRLAALLEADPALAPVPAPHGLGAEIWREAFRRAAALPGGAFTTTNAMAERQDPLALGTEALREFDALDRAFDRALNRALDRAADSAADKATESVTDPQAPSVPDQGASRARWSLRLVPAAQQPAILGLNFAHGGPHVTLPEMLMLQLMRAIEGLAPIDGGEGRSSFTWLAGTLADGRLAARHVFDAGAIRITAREVGSQGPHLGSRPPVG